jgi:HK97 family phage major capsid protein
MDKLAIYNKLKEAGKIPVSVPMESYSDEQILALSAVLDAPIPPASNNNAEEIEALRNQLSELTNSLEKKYTKLPSFEITENESQGLSDIQKANLKFRKCLNYLANGGKLTLNSEGTNAAGLYTVPTEFIARVNYFLNDYGIFRKFANKIQMSSKVANLPSVATAPTGAFVDELNAKPESNIVFGQTVFTRHDYAFITGLSNQLLQDTGINLIDLLAKLAANDFAKTEDTQGFLGTGSPITGLKTISGVYPVTLLTSDPASLVYADLIAMITGIPKTDGARWFLNRTILGHILGLADLQSRPIFTMADQNFILSSKTFMGYPYETSEVLPTTAVAVSSPIIFFGNLQNATLAERNSLEIAMSEHATVGSNNAFEKNMKFYRFEESYDIVIEQPTLFSKAVTKSS